MPVRTKRIYDLPSAEDGHRLLVMRLWPRGIRKEAVYAWRKELAPSEELRRAYLRQGQTWEVFAKAYLEEMALHGELVAELAGIARNQTVTLLCSCREESRCHRILLKGLVDALLA